MARRKSTTIIRGRVSESSYSKRLLAESLISSGFVSNMARAIAERVESELDKIDAPSITKSELREIVHSIVNRDYGEEYAKQYPIRRDLDYDVMVEGEGARFPYSKGIMAQSLMASGFQPNVAYEAARSIEVKLKNDHSRDVSQKCKNVSR